MPGPSLYGANLPSGSATSTLTSKSFTAFIPGQTLYLSFYYTATRITGTNTDTIKAELQWYNSSGGLISSAFTTTNVNGSTSGYIFKETPLVAPANAVSGLCIFTVTPGGATTQHNLYIAKIRLGRTQVGATLGAQAGATLFGLGGAVVNDVTGLGGGPFSTDTRNPNQLFNHNPNLLYNGGFRLLGVNTSGVLAYPLGFTWGASWGVNNNSINIGDWTYAYLVGPLTTFTSITYSDPFPLDASTAYMQEAEMFGGTFTAGSFALDIAIFSTQALAIANGSPDLGLSTQMGVVSGSGWTKRIQGFTTPSGTSPLWGRVRIYGNAITMASNQVCAIRKIKISKGSVETPFTDESTSGHRALTTGGSGHRLGNQRNLPAINGMNMRYRTVNTSTRSPSSLLHYSSTPTTATIDLPAAVSALYGSSGDVNYNTMTTATITNTGTAPNNFDYHIYVEDPNYAGGTPAGGLQYAKAILNVTDSNVLFQNDGYVYLGTITVGFPSSGTGGATGGSGGGGSCVAHGEKVYTDRGWLDAEEVNPGDKLLVLTEDNEDYEWSICQDVKEDWELCCKLTGVDSGISVIVSTSTPITTKDGITDVDNLEDKLLPFYEDGKLWWEAVTAEKAGLRKVRKIEVNQKTYVAGSEAGRGIATHNPKP